MLMFSYDEEALIHLLRDPAAIGGGSTHRFVELVPFLIRSGRAIRPAHVVALAMLGALLGAAQVDWRLAANPDLRPAAPAVVAAEFSGAAGDARESLEVPEALRVRRTTLGRGGTLAAALGRVGVSEELSPEIQRAAGRHLDPRRMPAKMGISATRDGNGDLRAVSFRMELERYLRVSVSGPATSLAPRSEVLRLPVVRSIEAAGGHVERSVAQAFSNSPHGLQLTNAFADIFQWDIDLLVEPRPGDRVRIVYEAVRLGSVPNDVPSFGDAPLDSGDFMGVGRVLAASYDGALATSTGFWLESENGVGGYYDSTGEPLRKAFLKSPLNYRRISSGFSNARRHPVTHRVVAHRGVDFAAAPGTPVVATADGRVTSASWEGPLGRAVRLRHGGSLVTVYGHLRGFADGIRPGAEVRQNQVIGYVGSTGRATGPHLHYTMIQNGRAIDPLSFRNPPSKALPDEQRPALLQARDRWLPVMEQVAADGYEVAIGTGTDDGVRPGA
jgi:murein DD-endopeptidase MepM/ murein hydrolase activator NlpD